MGDFERIVLFAVDSEVLNLAQGNGLVLRGSLIRRFVALGVAKIQKCELPLSMFLVPFPSPRV